MSPNRKLLVVVAVVVLVAGGAVWYGRRNESSVSVKLPKTVEVVYKLDGTARSADITIQTPSGSTQQQGVDVPLKTKSGSDGLTFSMGAGDFMYISAQNNGDGTLTCHILVDGVEVAANTARGEYAIATCQS